MSQTVNSSKQVIPGLPRKPLTPEQQAAADKKAQQAKLDAELKAFEKQLATLQCACPFTLILSQRSAK